jgi:thiol-disulfide isomerase/thioredoxin
MKSRYFALILALLAAPLSMSLSAPVSAAELKTLPAKPAPALALPALDGGTVRIDGLRGKVVLVNFWAVWCPPCRKEMPSMARLADKLAGQPFTLLGVNVGETPEEIRAFLKQVPVNFPIVLDSEGANLKAWNVFAFPTSYVVDKKGRLRLGLFGSIEWDSPEAVTSLETLLAEAD